VQVSIAKTGFETKDSVANQFLSGLFAPKAQIPEVVVEEVKAGEDDWGDFGTAEQNETEIE